MYPGILWRNIGRCFRITTHEITDLNSLKMEHIYDWQV